MVVMRAVCVAAALLAAPANAGGLSAQAAVELANSALASGGISDGTALPPSRALPECKLPVTAGPLQGNWSSVELRCADPVWSRVLRTTSVARSAPMDTDTDAEPGTTETVFALRKAMAKNAVIAPEDLVLVPRNRLAPEETFSAPEHLVGRRLSRAIPAGRPILARHLQEEKIIESGQKVIIVSGLAGMQISMAGEARTGGSFGELVDVVNLNSGKVVSARIIGRDIVEVPLKPFRNAP